MIGGVVQESILYFFFEKYQYLYFFCKKVFCPGGAEACSGNSSINIETLSKFGGVNALVDVDRGNQQGNNNNRLNHSPKSHADVTQPLSWNKR